tara:strand:- start:97 stop:777 length:681 start_codon:yes stop_codon:yes gene_type:complete
MAYVRKTDTLVTAITDKVIDISRTAQKRYDVDAVVFDSAQQSELVEAAHLSAWSEAPELRHTMPKGWVINADEATLRIYGPADEQGINTMAMAKTIHGTFKLPHTRDSRSYRPSVDVLYQYLSTSIKDIVSQSADKAQKQSDIKAKFQIIREQLKCFMDQHASLNTALKEMPQLEMYVPDYYMRQIRAESAPRAKAEQRSNVVDLNIDVDALAAAAITHRIATATS